MASSSMFTKNCLVAALLICGSLVILSNAACIQDRMSRLRNQPKEFCMENGVTRPMNSSWTRSDCMNCTCTVTGINCCSPGKPHSEGCEAIFDQTTCSFTLKRIDNSDKECTDRFYM